MRRHGLNNSKCCFVSLVRIISGLKVVCAHACGDFSMSNVLDKAGFSAICMVHDRWVWLLYGAAIT